MLNEWEFAKKQSHRLGWLEGDPHENYFLKSPDILQFRVATKSIIKMDGLKPGCLPIQGLSTIMYLILG